MNKINVAIADDNQRTVEMMTELLEQESDIEVIASADDGEEALRIIKEKQPDVVLLDIIMPKLDGIGVLERLQTEDLSKRPIIIMVSAMGQENVCEEAMELGASYFILKPFDLRTIIKQIKQGRTSDQTCDRGCLGKRKYGHDRCIVWLYDSCRERKTYEFRVYCIDRG